MFIINYLIIIFIYVRYKRRWETPYIPSSDEVRGLYEWLLLLKYYDINFIGDFYPFLDYVLDICDVFESSIKLNHVLDKLY